MINIDFNSKKIQVSNNITLQELLVQNNVAGNFFAVAINKEFISRKFYSETILKENDCVEILIPMQGG